jgi:hypothetical protein
MFPWLSSAHINFDGMKYKYGEELWYYPESGGPPIWVRITGTWGPAWDKEYYEITENDCGVEIVRTAAGDALSRSKALKEKCVCGGASVNATAHSSWCGRFDDGKKPETKGSKR